MKHSAGQTKVKWNPAEDGEPLFPEVEKGKAAAFAALESTPWLLNKLRALCLHVANVPKAPTLEEIQAMGPEEPTDDTPAES